MIKFKSSVIENQWQELKKNNLKLKQLVTQLHDILVSPKYDKDVTITEILRTPEETAALYADTPEELRPKNKPHEHWDAVDLRAIDPGTGKEVFTSEEVKEMLAYLNKARNYQGRSVAIYHQILGNRFHFHIQYR